MAVDYTVEALKRGEERCSFVLFDLLTTQSALRDHAQRVARAIHPPLCPQPHHKTENRSVRRTHGGHSGRSTGPVSSIETTSLGHHIEGLRADGTCFVGDLAQRLRLFVTLNLQPAQLLKLLTTLTQETTTTSERVSETGQCHVHAGQCNAYAVPRELNGIDES